MELNKRAILRDVIIFNGYRMTQLGGLCLTAGVTNSDLSRTVEIIAIPIW